MQKYGWPSDIFFYRATHLFASADDSVRLSVCLFVALLVYPMKLAENIIDVHLRFCFTAPASFKKFLRTGSSSAGPASTGGVYEGVL